MKIPLILSLSLLSVELGAAPADDYVNWIRQTQVDADGNSLEWDVTVTPSGESLSQEGVGPEGSFFQLWSIHSSTAKEYMLDEQFVSTYLPTAKITILTGDPYTSVKRTRVDQPFSVTITVAGLDDGSSGLDPADIPEAAKKVKFDHLMMSYDEVTHQPVAGVGYESVAHTEVTKIGDTVNFYEITNLQGVDLRQVEGEEVFTVTTFADFGTVASTLDSQRLQVWPIATGSLTGIDSTVRYVDIPTIYVDCVDLYPKSETYVRGYLGSPTANPTNPFLLPASYVKIADSIPQNREMALKDLDELFEKEGPYTLELLHETPFGYDILDQIYPMKVDRTIEVNLNLYSGE
jgi:hypothetical protein